MNKQVPLSLVDILLLPGSASMQEHVEYIDGHISSFQSKGRHLYRHEVMDSGESKKFLSDGVYVMQSKDIGIDFALKCVSAGKGFFGGKKTKVVLFFAPKDSDEYTISGIYKNPVLLMLSLANLYNFGEFGPYGEAIEKYPEHF